MQPPYGRGRPFRRDGTARFSGSCCSGRGRLATGLMKRHVKQKGPRWDPFSISCYDARLEPVMPQLMPPKLALKLP